MKTIIRYFAALTLIASAANASVTLQINSSGWGDASSAGTNGMAWGIIISSDNAGFGGSFLSDISSALIDFTVPALANPADPVQIAGTNYYFARGTTDTSNSGPPTFTDGYMGFANINLNSPVGAGDAYGLLWFPTGTSEGSSFGFQDLSLALPSDGSTVTDISTTPGLATNTIGVAGIPEPSRMILAMLGFVGLMFRRRR